MTREETKELLPIMQAFAEGKIIEYKFGNGWLETNCPVWTRDSEYRIKSEPKYRPFKNQEECWNEMLKHQLFGWIKDREGQYRHVMSVRDESDFAFWFENYTFIDGIPFGILE